MKYFIFLEIGDGRVDWLNLHYRYQCRKTTIFVTNELSPGRNVYKCISKTSYPFLYRDYIKNGQDFLDSQCINDLYILIMLLFKCCKYTYRFYIEILYYDDNHMVSVVDLKKGLYINLLKKAVIYLPKSTF